MYTVEWLEDSFDCEDCGGSYASGYRLLRNGEVVKERIPNAYCYGSRHYQQELVLLDILILEGVEFDLNPWEWMIPENERDGEEDA